MARYGLGQIDLNLRAQLALIGLSNCPEADISELFSSSQPIEPLTRKLLAEALNGSSSSLGLKASRKTAGLAVRSFLLRLNRLATGRLAIEKISQSGYEVAIKNVADQRRISEKSVEADVTFVKKFESWVDEIRSSEPKLDVLDDRALEIAYIYADVTKQDPRSAIKNSLPNFAQLIDDLEKMLSYAAGYSLPLKWT